MKNWGKQFDEAFKNWPIRKKLLMSHGSIIVLTFVLIVALLVSMLVIESNVKSLFEGPTTSTFYMGDIRVALAGNQRAINRVIAVGEKVVAEEEAAMEANYTLMTEALEVLETTLMTEESKVLLLSIEEELVAEQEHRQMLISLMEAGDFTGVNIYDETYYSPVVDRIREHVDTLDQQVFAVGENYANSSTTIALVLVGIGVVMLIVITAYAVYIMAKATKNIVEPVAQLEEASKSLYAGDMSASKNITYASQDELGNLAESLKGSMDTLKEWVIEISATLAEIADGDLTKPFAEITDFRGDFASIKDSFVLILKQFNDTLATIAQSSRQIDSGSDEIAKSATDLASGTTEQASAVEELNATVATVVESAHGSADKTGEAYTAVMKSVAEAAEEQKMVHSLQEEMQRIKEISGEIANIIVTIEGIASQTSLLALNASIEAARAGEAGRGFAVVAEQIGKLAQESAQAAVSTKSLIEDTLREIDNGSKITDETVTSFEKIIGDLNEFAVLTESVREETLSVADAMGEIEKGIEQISEVTQVNAAASEESSAVAEELAAKASELDFQIQKFKLYS